MKAQLAMQSTQFIFFLGSVFDHDSFLTRRWFLFFSGKVVAETSTVVKSEVNSTVETQSLKKTELKRELSKTVEFQENTQLCSTLEFAR